MRGTVCQTHHDACVVMNHITITSAVENKKIPRNLVFLLRKPSPSPMTASPICTQPSAIETGCCICVGSAVIGSCRALVGGSKLRATSIKGSDTMIESSLMYPVSL